MEVMTNSSSRRFPVTVTHLPVTRCQICHRTVAYRPSSLSEVLTEHYRRAHPEALGLLFPVAGPVRSRHRARRGPHATARWLTGSGARDTEEVIRAAFDPAGARDRQHAPAWGVLVAGCRPDARVVPPIGHAAGTIMGD